MQVCINVIKPSHWSRVGSPLFGTYLELGSTSTVPKPKPYHTKTESRYRRASVPPAHTHTSSITLAQPEIFKFKKLCSKRNK